MSHQTNEMALPRYLWLLLCYAQYASSDVIDQYAVPSYHAVGNWMVSLPVVLGVDETSGCICRANEMKNVVVCFGGAECKTFPKVTVKSDTLRVRTSIIERIRRGELDTLSYLKVLELESNHRLKEIEPGSFKNLTELEVLSISYSTHLLSIPPEIFDGLTKLRNLTMVNNGFSNILNIIPTLSPRVLPALESLDLSDNIFEVIPEEAFRDMEGTKLRKLQFNLCQIDYIHSKSFLPLKFLKELSIARNDLNSTLIEDFLSQMIEAGINLTHLDLSGMGFRRHPPRKLLEVISQSTIRVLHLARNQFEVILDDSFPTMVNIEVLDLTKVSVFSIGSRAFDSEKFPNLKALYLSGNNLAGIHRVLCNQLKLLDMSYNTVNSPNPVYYEIESDTFVHSKELHMLILSFNRIKSLTRGTFRGLEKLRLLNMENGTIYHIGNGTFEPMPILEVLNLANNPLTESANFTRAQFLGLSRLKVLIMRNCGIKFLDEEDNIFVNMPSLQHLILKNNQLYYITAKILRPLHNLRVIDLSDNFLIAWSAPMFAGSAVKPQNLILDNNKITHFSMSMLEDIDFLLGIHKNSTEIYLMGNFYVCDCNAMYKTYTWIEANASFAIKQYFKHSKFICSTPDLWEDRRVFEYLLSIKSLPCIMYDSISKAVLLIQTTPAIVMLLILFVLIGTIAKFRVYIKYWLFLAKLSLGRKFIRKSLQAQRDLEIKEYKYDAFVSYCNEDRDFVLGMISEMESNPPYLKLCVYERDFEIGSFISESILNSVNESKYIILIISNGFAKSQWCRWETQLAEYHRLFLEDGTAYDPLVLVRIGAIESKYITTTLKYLLKTKIYLTWDDRHPDEFWKKLRNVLTKR